MNTQSVSQTLYGLSYHSISKSTTMLKIIFKLYGSIYNISVDDCFEKCYPLLVFIESLIYEADNEIENNQTSNSPLTQLSISPWDERKTIIQSLLKELNLEHPTILNQLEKLEEYFKLESQLVTSETITYEDVVRASELRSSDLRILHCTLIQILGKSYRPEVFELMLPREVLIEFADDCYSYQEDVAAGNYNTYWIFEKMYGEEAHYYLQAEVDRYRRLFEEKLNHFPKEEQELYSVKWSRFWKRYPYLSSAELIRQVVLESH